jgi:hypothetical protein
VLLTQIAESFLTFLMNEIIFSLVLRNCSENTLAIFSQIKRHKARDSKAAPKSRNYMVTQIAVGLAVEGVFFEKNR